MDHIILILKETKRLSCSALVGETKFMFLFIEIEVGCAASEVNSNEVYAGGYPNPPPYMTLDCWRLP